MPLNPKKIKYLPLKSVFATNNQTKSITFVPCTFSHINSRRLVRKSFKHRTSSTRQEQKAVLTSKIMFYYRWESPFMGLADIDRFMQKTMGEKAGITWLMLAARDGNLQSCLELVKKGGNAKATTHFGVTLLHFAALNKRHAVKIASHFDDQGLDLMKKDVDWNQ